MRSNREQADAAFEEFVRASGDRLFRTALLICGNWHLAEDLVQTTLAKMYSTGAWHKVDVPEAYARRALINAHISVRRKRSSREVPVDNWAESAAGSLVGADPSTRIDLFNALGKLSKRDRAIVILRYWDDLSVNDTAAIIGCSSGAIRTRSTRALQKLRSHLTDQSLAAAGAYPGEVSHD